MTIEQTCSLGGTQKSWTQPVYVKTAHDFISRMKDKLSKDLNAQQGKIGSQWLNVVPCKKLGLKLANQQLRLGANICVAHTCHCGKRVKRDRLHGLSRTKSAGRSSSQVTLNALKKQTLGFLDLPSMLVPRGVNRIDCKRPEGVTMISPEIVIHLVWDVTVVDARQSRLHSIKAPWATRESPPPRLNRVKLGSISNYQTMDTLFNQWPWKYRVL